MTEKNREGLAWNEWAAATGLAVLSTPHHEAWLRGEDPTEWKAEAQKERGPTRWVITYFSKKGYRTLLDPAQGRYTYETKEEAEERMRVLEPGLREKILGADADSLAVLPVECWPGHHDPKKTVFGVIDLMGAVFWDAERQSEEIMREAAIELKVPVEYLNPPSISELERSAAQKIQEDIFGDVVRDMLKAAAVPKEHLDPPSSSYATRRCTCDAFCDDPCSVHAAENAAQNERIAADQTKKEKP